MKRGKGEAHLSMETFHSKYKFYLIHLWFDFQSYYNIMREVYFAGEMPHVCSGKGHSGEAALSRLAE